MRLDNVYATIIAMERLKPVEFLRDTVGLAANVGRYALHQVAGGSWGALGERYGEAVGGHNPHPASITIYSTPEHEQLQFEIPDNIVVGAE